MNQFIIEQQLDQDNIKQCEQEWESSKKKLSIKEWAEIFPDAKQVIQNNILEILKELRNCYFNRHKEIKKQREVYYWLLVLSQELKESIDKIINEYIVTQEIIPLEERFKRFQWDYINLTRTVEDKSVNIEELKSRHDLREVAERYSVKFVKKSGKNWTAHCPFGHQDKTPSCSFSEKLYYCFSCGKSGDLINFIQEMDGCNFKEAINKLN